MYSMSLMGLSLDTGTIVSLVVVLCVLIPAAGLIYWYSNKLEKDAKNKTPKQFYSNRWMTPSEMNRVHIFTTLSQLKTLKKTGPLMRFEPRGREIEINMASKDYHVIVLGTTGAAKTQGYLLPFAYTLGHSGEKPNMVFTDPKGELHNYLGETLRRQGYDVQVYNLSEPSKSSRWNPFENAWHLFQRAHNLDKEFKKHTGTDPKTTGLRIIAPQYQNEWYEFNKIAFPTFQMADMERKTLKQRLISDCESDIKDICSAICPLENEKDKSWEMGARDLIQGTAIAMLEDSLIPELGMTKDKFNFYNIFKILSLRDNDPQSQYGSVKNYFEGRHALSPAVQLANTVVTNHENTMKNFFGTVTGKLSMFADKGICYITSGTDLDFNDFIKKPIAFFLIIPDQIKIRHPLAILCVSQLYKKLVELANSLGGKLKWLTYFLLDEFGNMPKFENFATVVTVSRSRGIRLCLVLQDYKQLETIYGPQDAITIRNNCNTQVLVGANDMETRKAFSDLLGEMTVDLKKENVTKTTGKAKEQDKDSGSISYSTDTVSRPLMPPNEMLDMQQGNVVIFCFGTNPVKAKIMLFFQCIKNGLIQVYKPEDVFKQANYFDEEGIYYDIRRRNDIVLKGNKKNDMFDW